MTDLRHQIQANRHKPDEGIYGDCARTVIACLLELPRDDVPHFAEDDPDTLTYNHRIDNYLAEQHGLSFVRIPFLSGDGFDSILQNTGRLNPGLRFLLLGKSRRCVNHIVICQDGKIEHDTSCPKVGIIGPSDPDDLYWLYFLTPIKLIDRWCSE